MKNYRHIHTEHVAAMKTIVFLIVMLTIVCNDMTARKVAPPRVLHYTTSGYTILDFVQDKRGAIWCGTSDGLKSYNDIVGDQTLSNHREIDLGMIIEKIQCDNEGNLWLENNYHKYMIYDPLTEEVIDDVEQVVRGWGIHVWYSFGIDIDPDGNFWIYKDNKIYHRTENEVKSLEFPDVKWFIGVTHDHNRTYFSTSEAIYVIDRATLHQRSVIPLPKKISPTDLRMITNNGRLWLCSEKEVFMLDIPTETWRVCDQLSSMATALTTYNEGICVGTNASGLRFYDGRGDCVAEMHTPILQSERINSMYADKADCLWVSYGPRGASVIDWRNTDSLHPLVNEPMSQVNDILSLAIWGERMMLGTNYAGLHYAAEGKIGQVNEIGSHEAICCMHIDKAGTLWAGAFQSGLYRIAKSGGVTKYFQGLSPLSIIEDKGGDLYITFNNNIISRFSPSTGEVRNYELPHDYIYATQLQWGPDSTLLVGSSIGVWSIDKSTGKSKKLRSLQTQLGKLVTSNIIQIVYDSRGLLWQLEYSGRGRVGVLNMKSDSLMTIPQIKDQNITNIVETDDGCIWLTGDTKFIKIRMNTNQKNGYSMDVTDFPLANYVDCNYRTATLLSDGKMGIGCVNGYYVFDYKKFNTNYKPTNLRRVLNFSLLRVNDTPVKTGEIYNGRVLLNNNIRYAQKLELHHDENNILLEFCAQDYDTPYKEQYYYKLLPIDRDWKMVTNNTIQLSNLPSGNYKVIMGVKNLDGSMITLDLTLDIDIDPPIYLSSWAYMIYIALFLSMALCVWRILTIRKAHQKELENTRIEAQRQHQIDEMKLRFFTNISHDIKTPLSLIITPLEDIMTQIKDERILKFLQPVRRNALRLLTLINQLLDFRKLEMYGGKLNPTYSDVVECIKGVCDSFISCADDTKITLTVHSDFQHLEMSFDRDKIEKIILNLLSNAFKYTDANGSVTVNITSRDNMLIVSVADTGRGISDSDKKLIFNRFYQINEDNYTQIGTGIGLNVVREFIQLHDGEIDVKDNHPAGSIFTFSIPIKKAMDRQEDNISSQPDEADSAKTILLVEDNIDFLAYLGDTLSPSYKILRATNGEEALQVMESNDVDLVVSDVMMNGMDGLTLCSKIKNNVATSHIPVILLTAKFLQQDELEGFEYGADDYVTKPCNMSILKYRIKRLLDRNERSKQKFKMEIDVSPEEMTFTSIDEKLMKRAIEIVEKNISDTEFSVETLSRELGMHRTSLYKKLLYLTGKTPIEFIRIIKLKKAIQLMKVKDIHVSEIAYSLGFNSPRIFAKYFKEEYGKSPSEYHRELHQNDCEP